MKELFNAPHLTKCLVTVLVLYGAIMGALQLWTLWTGNSASIGLGNVCVMLQVDDAYYAKGKGAKH